MFIRRRWVAFGELWRRSLQVRVVTSVLALSSAVVFVLGMVLQNEITDRLLTAKEQAAEAQAATAQRTVNTELRGVNPGSDDLPSRLANALNSLTSSSSDDQQQVASSAAGAFEPVLADAAGQPDGQVVSAGPYDNVPAQLRADVQADKAAAQITTVTTAGVSTTYVVVGAPITSASQPMQLYLLFPLTSEQHTIAVVRDTLVVGGIVLVLLLAGITNLVIRQVVRPVREAVGIAERFADGHLDERMRVVGEDDMARLAEAYNQLAESVQTQIHQLEEFGQLQRRFSSDVSHELRTPLTTVRMAADVLHASREQFPGGLARSTELMVDELDRFEALLGDLLEISRLDAGVEELAPEQVDVRGLARTAADSVRGIIGATTRIVLDLPDEEVPADVDARRVERILRNLLANAVDHGEGEPVRVTVAANERAVAVAVRDYGVGLRPGEEELVFNRFWRADPSRNRRTGGTGLGLAISLEDARLHGGRLEAWGEPGAGACFRLTLPRHPRDEITDSPLPLPPADASPRVEPPPVELPPVEPEHPAEPEPAELDAAAERGQVAEVDATSPDPETLEQRTEAEPVARDQQAVLTPGNRPEDGG
ncbi:MAG TPA: MtrAB system histidine kinase MtrB [Pseudonocardiaceae bacterium]|nr:MtrAB system histidine kinase MtrB [Pseudonocardiaceae bacterium]